jgi:hypothetical protein
MEIDMKIIAALSFAAALIAIPALGQAQDERSASGATSQQGNQGNKGPDQEKGSTGWGGGSKAQGSAGHPIDQTTGKEVEIHDESEASQQAPIATGADLKGPPAQLPPSKTPE